MTDLEVVESFNNAWRSLCKQYDKYPDESTRQALNMLSKIIGIVQSEVDEKNRVQALSTNDWNLLWHMIFD